MPAADATNITTPLTPSMVEGELRILDIDLAARLGFDRPRDIRKLIKRYEAELDLLGPRATVARVVNGGRATEFYLNKKQAIFITTKSETAEATAITIEIIERFDAYERGAVPALRPAPRPRKLSVLATFREGLRIAKLMGLDDDEAARHAGRYCQSACGKNPLEMMGYRSALPEPVDPFARTPNEQRALVLLRQMPEAARPLAPMLLRRFGSHGPSDAELRAEIAKRGLADVADKLLALVPPHPVH